MATRKPSIFTTQVLFCSRKYSIVNADGDIVFLKVDISFMTEGGFFAATLPKGQTFDSFKKYEGYELREIPYENEDVFAAGEILKCTNNGFYGRFYKDCIHRAREYGELRYTIRSASWIQKSSVGIWHYYGKPTQFIYKGKITAPSDRKKEFIVECLDKRPAQLMGSIVMCGWFCVGIVTDTINAETKELRCISAEVLLRELLNCKDEYRLAVAEGKIEGEEDPEFIIHNGVLERYQGNAEMVVVPDGVHTIGEKAFYYSYGFRHVKLPDTVRRIESAAFYICRSLQSVNLPDSIVEISDNAFTHCESLASVKLPKNLKKIEQSSFWGCKKLSSVELPSGLEIIEDHAFEDCSSLTEIDIPDSVKKIGSCTFYGCKKLKEISISDAVEIGNRTFDETPWLRSSLRKNGALILNDALIAVSDKLTKYAIPANVNHIGVNAFFRSNIESLYIPDNVKTIGRDAFACSKMRNIRLPQGLTKIEEHTFDSCEELEDLVVPKSVNWISNNALNNLPNCIVTILNDEEDAMIGDYSFAWGETPCVKEVRVYSSSAAESAVQKCGLRYTLLYKE